MSEHQDHILIRNDLLSEDFKSWWFNGGGEAKGLPLDRRTTMDYCEAAWKEQQKEIDCLTARIQEWESFAVKIKQYYDEVNGNTKTLEISQQ